MVAKLLNPITVPIVSPVSSLATGFYQDNQTSLFLQNLNGRNGFYLSNAIINSVSEIGDINGDGIDDFLLGEDFSEKAYVVFGQADGFDVNLDLNLLDGNNGFEITSLGITFDNLGRSVSNAGDVNGDGIDDIILGAPSVNPGDDFTQNSTGESYVIFGSDQGFSDSLNVADLDGSNGFAIYDSSLGFFSATGIGDITSAGDMNGDGIDDIAIGYVEGDFNTGKVAVVYGTRQGFAASIDVGSLDGTNGFVITEAQSGDSIGSSISSAGDFNNNGFDDLVIAADNTTDKYVVYGFSNDEASGEPLTVELEKSVSTGTTNADNLAVAEVGSNVTYTYTITNTGTEDLGTADLPLIIIDDNGTPGDTSDDLSIAVAGGLTASGINLIGGDDGNGELEAGETWIFEADSQTAQKGEVTNTVSFNLGSDVLATDTATYQAKDPYIFSVLNLDGTNGFTITDLKVRDLSSTDSVSNVGDFNGDGIDDFLLSVAGDAFPGSEPGGSIVVYGSEQGFDPILDFEFNGITDSTFYPNPDNSFVIEGFGGSATAAVSGVGDFNGDGIADVLVKAGVIGGTLDIPSENIYATYVVYGSTNNSDRYLQQFESGGESGNFTDLNSFSLKPYDQGSSQLYR